MKSKQKNLQTSASILPHRRVFAALCVLCIGSGTLSAQGQTVGRDLGKDAAVLRLIAAPKSESGVYFAGVDIQMTPGSHTYWKMPGEAGVPPVFAFNGSENVASAVVQFPTPIRMTEEGLDAFAYSDHVTFPVAVTPKDAAKPIVLKADVTYAVCNKICIPAHGTAEVTWPSGATADGEAAITKALAAVPTPMPAAERAALSVQPFAGAAKPTWHLAWTGTTPVTDIFANAPEGYYFDTHKTGPATWTLVASQVVASDKPLSVPVELTLSRGDGGLVTSVPLDVAPAAK